MLCRYCKEEVPDGTFCALCGTRQVRPKKNPRTRANGTGTVFEYKKGKWCCRISYRDQEGDMKYKGKYGFPTKSAAELHLRTMHPPRIDEEPEQILSTFKDLWENYSQGEMAKLSKNKQMHYRIAWNRLSPLHNSTVKKATITQIQSIVDESAPTYYPARDIKDLLSHLYKRAMAQQEVSVNLSGFIHLPELEESEQIPFTKDELKKLWEDYEKHTSTGYLLLMVYSGMMPGELFGCKKHMIDYEKRQIVGCGLKTEKRKEIPIGIVNFMVPVLEKLSALSRTDKLLYIDRWSFYGEFHEILARCGIEDRTPYACRHTTATALALAGASEEDIKVIMRHANVETTRRYIHKEFDISPTLEVLDTSFSVSDNSAQE